MRKVATVFGGSGFIGRYVVKRLAAQGYVVRVAVRDTEAALFLKPMGVVGQVVPLYCNLARPNGDVTRAIEGAHIVVNCVGILAEMRSGDFERIHSEGAGAVARAAATGAGRLVHFSAVGAEKTSPSQYARSKAAGEAAVRTHCPAATIFRPSVVFGAEDKFFNRLAALAKFLPLMPVIFGATRMQPVYVGDVADAVMAALERTETAGRTFELGGPHIFAFREIVQYVLSETRRNRPLVPVPAALARLQALIAEHLPGKPLTLDQLRLLERDNIVSAGQPGLAELGLTPTPVALVVPQYLDRYRPGGGRYTVVSAP